MYNFIYRYGHSRHSVERTSEEKVLLVRSIHKPTRIPNDHA